MIILHNCQDKDSRDFLAAILGTLPDHNDFVDGKIEVGGHTIYCWYHGGREAWWEIAGTDKVSAFPSVIVDVPEHDIPLVDIQGQQTGLRRVAAHQSALRKPASVADVQAHLDDINQSLVRSSEVGGVAAAPDPLTLANMNAAATGRTV